MRNHNFVVGSFHLTLDDNTALSIFGITKLVTPSANMRVHAIKMLRHRTSAGLYDAKQIVDYIADNGRIESNGELTIDVPRQPVQYTAS